VNRDDLLQFMRSHRLAVQASVSASGTPQAAVVGIVVTDDLHIFFDTLDASWKAQNLRRNPKISFVIGGLIDGDERTVQYEGVADEPSGEELERLKELYFSRFPDGRERQSWPGLVYVRVRPTWIRYSDYSRTPPEIVEFDPSSPP
jgi:general stress protein 26